MENNSLIPIDGNVIPIEKNPVSLYLASLTSGSRQTMIYSLKEIVRTITSGQSDNIYVFPFWSLELAHIQLLKNTLSETHSINTTNLYLSAVKGVLKNSWRLGLISQEEYARKVDIKGVTGSDPKHGRALTKSEINKLLQSCDNTIKGIRDKALLSILIFTGMRRSEVAALTYDNFTEIEYEGKRGYLIQISHGKGNKSRQVYAQSYVYESVLAWIGIRGIQDGFMFPRLSKMNDLTKHISSQTIYDTLLDMGKKAGVDRFAPHDLRRTAITSMLDQGFDIATISKIAGHSGIGTTQRYDRRNDESIKNVSFGLTYDIKS